MRRIHHELLPFYYFYILTIARFLKPTVIFANYPHEVLLVASYKTAIKLNTPLFVYMHDLWQENMTRSTAKKFADKWEKEIFTKADMVICCTSAQQEFYKSKYNCSSELIVHPIPDEELNNRVSPTTTKNEKVTIVYSGSLSPYMNQDAFVQMSEALDLLSIDYEMIWYPVNFLPENLLHTAGITSNKIKIKYLQREELNQALSNADILFAPLSHKNCSMDEVKTVFSNKLLGYLNAGKPILVFGPANCHHAKLAREGNWGYVVDEDNPKALADAIVFIHQHPVIANELVQGAYKEAASRRASIYADKLLNWVDQKIK